MWPFHTWLPDAHVEAPTAGSILLAGVLLKLGGYGYLRFSLPILPDASEFFTPLIYTLSVVAVIYTSLVALMQEDMKKLIAYSSIAHMGLVTIGIFTPNAIGLDGSIFQMLSHGVVSGALFMGVGVVYDRLHTHEIARFGGLVERMPVYAAFFMLFALAGIGLPGTSGFVGEILVIVGVFEVNSWVALLATTGAFLGAAYMLWMYRRVFFGAMVKDELKSFKDLRPNELIAFVPLIAIIILMGVYPSLFLDPMEASVDHLLTQVGAPAAADLAAR
jgi:NADH-quinone oxidoreductase subunit M